jgi:hypothetical protein
VVTVTGSIAFRRTAVVTNHIGAASSGFNITRADAGALTVQDGARITIRFMQPVAALPHYGLRWVGNHLVQLQALRSAGKLVINDGGLGRTATVYVQSGATYVGIPPPAGTMFVLR